MNLRRRIAFPRGQDHATIRLHQGSDVSEMGTQIILRSSNPSNHCVAITSLWALWPDVGYAPENDRIGYLREAMCQ
jgi:hypothetical protein